VRLYTYPREKNDTIEYVTLMPQKNIAKLVKLVNNGYKILFVNSGESVSKEKDYLHYLISGVLEVINNYVGIPDFSKCVGVINLSPKQQNDSMFVEKSVPRESPVENSKIKFQLHNCRYTSDTAPYDAIVKQASESFLQKGEQINGITYIGKPINNLSLPNGWESLNNLDSFEVVELPITLKF
jgi:hypothetical protein